VFLLRSAGCAGTEPYLRRDRESPLCRAALTVSAEGLFSGYQPRSLALGGDGLTRRFRPAFHDHAVISAVSGAFLRSRPGGRRAKDLIHGSTSWSRRRGRRGLVGSGRGLGRLRRGYARHLDGCAAELAAAVAAGKRPVQQELPSATRTIEAQRHCNRSQRVSFPLTAAGDSPPPRSCRRATEMNIALALNGLDRPQRLAGRNFTPRHSIYT